MPKSFRVSADCGRRRSLVGEKVLADINKADVAAQQINQVGKGVDSRVMEKPAERSDAFFSFETELCPSNVGLA